jgi:predicted amidohydrolase
MQDLRVTLVQAELAWLDPAANRERFAEKILPLAGTTDLIVLPEMFTTGFMMEPERWAEQANGHTVDWLRALAGKTQATITGSVATRDGDRYYNRLLWVAPNGAVSSYDKRHLFRMAKEHDHYSPGAERLIVELGGWRICPLVCYDLRFPVWSRNRPEKGNYDVLIYVANWPERRRHAWQTLLRARAIENLCYCVGVNRVGADGSNISHTGDSVALDFIGQPLSELSERPFVQTVSLNHQALIDFRRKFPAHLDADEFELK